MSEDTLGGADEVGTARVLSSEADEDAGGVGQGHLLGEGGPADQSIVVPGNRTTDEVRRFLAVADGDGYAPFWHLACYLGLRPSEITGLKWESVDLDRATLYVVRARPTACGKTFDSEKTKSPSGRRILALPDPLVERLLAHRLHQQTLRALAEQRWKESGLVCTSEVGTAINHRNVQRHFQRLCRRAALTRIRVYDLRHTAASLMVDAGADLKAASEALGHSDPRITMKIYRHVRGDQRARAVSLLSEAITRPASKQETPPNRT